MKNTLIFILMFILGVSTGFSQKKISRKAYKKKKNELLYGGHWVGLNATGIIKSLFSFSPPSTADPYTVSGVIGLYKYKAIRWGTYLEIERSGNRNLQGIKAQQSQIGSRVGYQKLYPLQLGFYYFWGVDLTMDYSQAKSTFDAISKRTDRWMIGAGPILGFGYQWGDKFRLSTESSYYAKIGQLVDTLDEQGDVTTNKSGEFLLKFLTPNALYFSFKL